MEADTQLEAPVLLQPPSNASKHGFKMRLTPKNIKIPMGKKVEVFILG
jgi:hypothetical protein